MRRRRRRRDVVAWCGGDPCCGETRDWFEEREGERLNGVRSERRERDGWWRRSR